MSTEDPQVNTENNSIFLSFIKIILIIGVFVGIVYLGYKYLLKKDDKGTTSGGSGGSSEDNKTKCGTSPSLDSFKGKCDDIRNIKCGEDGKYYCDNNYCSNHAKLLVGGICVCTSPYTGQTCGCDSTPCGKGIMGDDCKCETCCDDTTSISGMCPKYNGTMGNCESDCSTEKGLHFVYDSTQGKCICPNGFEIDKDGHCVPLQCNNGILSDDKKMCVCNPGYTGPDCSVSICKNGGTYNPNTKICDCLPGFYGNYCEYDKSLCNYHGIPILDSNNIYTGKCKCDDTWNGDHCTCQGTKTRSTGDKCKGIDNVCTDKGWQQINKSCQEIYNEKDFGNENVWQRSCSPYLLNQDQSEDNQLPTCSDNPTRFGSTKTCQSKLDTSICDQCKLNGEGGCMCVTKDGTPSYQCYTQQQGTCGNVPPGICLDGSSPHCFDIGDGSSYTNVWACQGTSLPKDFAMGYYGVSDSKDGKEWYFAGSPYNTTIYPTFNMDQCDLYPFETLNTPNVNPGYTSFNSNYGFVYKDANGVRQFIKADPNDPKYKDVIIYNYRDAILSDDKKKIIGGEKISSNSKFDIMYPQGKGCAKWKTPYDEKLGQKNNECTNSGIFRQICTDKDYNIVDCTKNPYYITDIGYCDCMKPYVGQYCQYNTDEICNGGTFEGDSCTYSFNVPGSYTLNISPQYKYISWDIIGGGGGGGNAITPSKSTYVCKSVQPLECTAGGGISGGGGGSSGERSQKTRVPLGLNGNASTLTIKVGKGGTTIGEGSGISLSNVSVGTSVNGGKGGGNGMPASYSTVINISDMRGGNGGGINPLKIVDNLQIVGENGSVVNAYMTGVNWSNTINLTPAKGGRFSDVAFGAGGDGGIKGILGQPGNDGYVKIVLHAE